MPGGDTRAAARHVERDHAFGLPANGVHQLHALDAVVVIGLCLDIHFLEARDGSVARRLHHVHVRRPILDRANEVFGLPRIGQAVEIPKRDSVGSVLDNLHRGGELRRRAPGQRDRPAVRERELTGRDRPIGVDVERHVRAGRRIHVAAVRLGAGREAQGRRVRVVDVDSRDAGRVRHGHSIHRRGDRSGDDAVLEIGGGGRHRQAEPAARLGEHLGAAPEVAGADLDARANRRTVADEARLDRERRALEHARVAGHDLQTDPLRKQGERRRVERLARGLAGHYGEDDQRNGRGTSLESARADAATRHDLVDVDGIHSAGRVLDEPPDQERRRVAPHDVHGRRETVVERRHLLFDEPRELRVGRRAAERQQAPSQRPRGQHDHDAKHAGQRDRRPAAKRRQRPHGKRDRDDGRQRQRRPRGGIERRQRPQPRPDALQESPDWFVLTVHVRILV